MPAAKQPYSYIDNFKFVTRDCVIYVVYFVFVSSACNEGKKEKVGILIFSLFNSEFTK